MERAVNPDAVSRFLPDLGVGRSGQREERVRRAVLLNRRLDGRKLSGRRFDRGLKGGGAADETYRLHDLDRWTGYAASGDIHAAREADRHGDRQDDYDTEHEDYDIELSIRTIGGGIV